MPAALTIAPMALLKNNLLRSRKKVEFDPISICEAWSTPPKTEKPTKSAVLELEHPND